MNMKKTSNATRCAKLEAQSERNDAKARASAVCQTSSNDDAQIGESSAPAQAGTPSAPAEVALQPGEVYAGVAIWPNGDPYHIILSPTDKRVAGIYAAEALMRTLSKDHDLPTYVEFTILCKRMPNQFKASLYYTGDEEMFDGVMAPVLFHATPAGQTRRDVNEVRVRAIRRVPADENAVDFQAIMAEQRAITTDAAHINVTKRARGPAGEQACVITSAQVAAMASRLIDEVSSSDNEPQMNDDHLVAAGTKMGIVKMALKVQEALAAFGGEVGGHA